MSSITNVSNWSYLTGLVNEIRTPNTAVRDLLFNDEQTLLTETVEITTLNKAREMAPFVRKNGEALMVGGYTSTVGVVSAPNIRLKKPYVPSDVFIRRPGNVDVYANNAGGQIVSGFNEHILRELGIINGMVDATEEWLCCQALQGTISYSVADQEVFTITFPRDAASIIDLTSTLYWDQADPTLVQLYANIISAKRVAAEYGIILTDALMGSTASAALIKLIAQLKIPVLSNLNQIAGGSATLEANFSAKGFLFVGQIGGIRFWEYARTQLLNGVAQNLIRPKWVEWVSVGNNTEAGRSLKFGAIADWKALGEGKLASRRFAKTWDVEDPSSRMYLVAGRPLPICARKGATVSMQVCA